MMSFLKRLKNITFAFLGLAFIGGLSIASIQPKSVESTKAAEYIADLSYDETEGKFVYYYNGTPVDVVFDYIDYNPTAQTATLYFHDDTANGYHLATLTGVSFVEEPQESGAAYTGYVSGTFDEGNLISVNSLYIDGVTLNIENNTESYFAVVDEQLKYYYSDGTEAEMEITSIINEVNEGCATINCAFYSDGSLSSTQIFRIESAVFSASTDGDTYTGYISGSNPELRDVNIYFENIPLETDSGSSIVYEYGWNYDSTGYSLVYYDEDFGGEYSMAEAVNNVLDQVVTLTYSGRPATGGEGDTQTIDINYSSGGGYDETENTVSGYAILDGSSSEYVTVRLNVDLLEANAWIYNEGKVYWRDANSSDIDTNYLDIKKFVFVRCDDNIDNQYVEVDYTYTNGEETIDLPTLILNYASFSLDGDTYYVSGLYLSNQDYETEIEIPSDKWKEREYGTYDYEVIFDGNGATSGSMAVDEFNITEYSYSYELPQCAYQREGYAFTGWSYQPDETVMIFQPGTTQSITNGTTTFYAVWEAITYCTITFNANGGSGTMESMTIQKGTETEVPDCYFDREGYTFVCWAVGSPTSSTKVYAGEPVTVNEDYTLYAVWEAAKQYWVNINGELRFIDENHPEYFTRIDKVIYSESKLTATVLISIVTEENPDVVIDTKYISLSSAICEGEIVTGYFNLIVEGEKVISIEGVPITFEVIPTTDEEKAAAISQDQIDQINSLLPESQDARVNDVITDLNQGTANQIVEVASDAKTFIDGLREEGGEGYTEEDYQRDLNTVQSVTEAAVVVGGASKDTNIAAQVEDMTKSIPNDYGVDLNGVLKEFYEQQMSYLLGEEVASKEGETPSKGRTRALAPKVNKVDVDDFLKQEFNQMLDFVDRSVVNIEGTLLQVRKCSHASVKMEVNRSITTITSKSFRDFDKAKADREFVKTLEPVMMATMQSQVLSILEEEYKNSDHRNKEKDQVMLDEIEAIKDIEVFRIIVMEVLKEKYESLPGAIVYDDLQEFTDKVYWPAFEAWALDKESPVGFTFEELTQATIEKSTKRANNFELATTAGKPEIIFGAIFGGVAVLAISGAVIVPTVLKKKRRGLVN